MSTTLVDKRSRRIQEMFGRVAPRYDLLNHLLSGCFDIVWRRRAAAALDLPAESRVVDLCCGTGDQSLALTRRGYRVVASDFCLPMLALAQPKYRRHDQPPLGIAGDAMAMPTRTGLFDGATAAFGLRNVADLDLALDEIARIVRPGGRVAFLEFTTPQRQPFRALYLTYFQRILPAVGRLFSKDESAYDYLPESVLQFPQREEFTSRMRRAGLGQAEWQSLSMGILCLYTGTRR